MDAWSTTDALAKYMVDTTRPWVSFQESKPIQVATTVDNDRLLAALQEAFG